MKTQEQLDQEMPARLLSAACAIIAAIHFYNCSGKADFVLLGLIALCAVPWMGSVFESVSKDGVKYRIEQGNSPAPPTPLAELAIAAPAPANVSPSEFSIMANQEKKVLATLWKYQKIHFQNRRDQHWTFTVGQRSPEYTEFSLGFLLLAARGYATVAASGQVMLTETGYNFSLSHDLEISTWPNTYDNFSN